MAWDILAVTGPASLFGMALVVRSALKGAVFTFKAATPAQAPNPTINAIAKAAHTLGLEVHPVVARVDPVPAAQPEGATTP